MLSKNDEIILHNLRENRELLRTNSLLKSRKILFSPNGVIYALLSTDKHVITLRSFENESFEGKIELSFKIKSF